MELIGNAWDWFDRVRQRNYCYYMKPVELKVARIGNSRGVRIPAATLARYRIGPTVVMEERSDGILLRPLGSPDAKLSWEDTARDMARTAEDWSDWDRTAADAVETLPWEPGKTRSVAEGKPAYRGQRRPGKS